MTAGVLDPIRALSVLFELNGRVKLNQVHALPRCWRSPPRNARGDGA